ncbi:hypothetical protein C7T35_31545 [Variovorax sp. WS11]|uniref:hypothetical protein n=1 Tax=Variovorax sp. WS11 TaxID=1105204 RepID=UPI000D0C9B2E|nr:hypothetical protein [Variovorax sp. WS11]NDZ17275.1 hypothetical protein [Variovorax sp. WS11]PSL80536.1 hypothetical protein C7T35_31545 [Variovorax sp. WS11]
MTGIQAKRRFIVIALLCVALGGALLRQLSAPGSTARDVGTLLMLLWLPIIGNVIAWLIGKLRRPVPAQPAGFEAGSTFHPHALVELTLRAPQLPSEDSLVPEGEHRCALVVDNEGFSARWVVAPGQAFRRGTAQTLQFEFLKPATALPRFQRNVVFRILMVESFVGDGRVLELLGHD